MKPRAPWMIRKRGHAHWTIWKWHERVGRYVAWDSATSGAEAIEAFAAGAA